MAHDLVGVLLENFIAVLARERRKGERRSRCDREMGAAQLFEIAEEDFILRARDRNRDDRTV